MLKQLVFFFHVMYNYYNIIINLKNINLYLKE